MAQCFPFISHLWHHVGRVDPGTLGVDTAVLPLVEVDKVDRVVFHVAQGRGLGERRHLEVHVLFLSRLEPLKNEVFYGGATSNQGMVF